MADEPIESVENINPLTGTPFNEETERARLRPFGIKTTEASQELQEKFVSFIDQFPWAQKKSLPFKVVPEVLGLYRDIKKMATSWQFERVYFSYQGEEVQEKDIEFQFQNTVEASFGDYHNGNVGTEIHRRLEPGETPSGSESLHISPWADSMYFKHYGSYGDIDLVYSKKDKSSENTSELQSIICYFGEKRTRLAIQTGVSKGGPEGWVKVPGMEELLRDVHLEIEEDGNLFKATLKSEEAEDDEGNKVTNKRIVVQRFEGEELKDTISVPVHLKPRAINEKLFNSLTLKDPLNAPADLDVSWRFADLMQTLSVKWEPPKSMLK